MRSKESLITGAMLLLITYTLSLSLVSQAFPAGQTTRTLSSTGSIQIQTTTGIGVYSNLECTTPMSAMSWGTLQPGGSSDVVCYVKNEGSAATTLSMQTSNWSPGSASSYLTLDWNYNGQPINPGATVIVVFTLTVDSGITGITSFSFDVTIIGS